jgi:selenide,water dikinase
MGAGPLREALAGLPDQFDPKLLVGANTADDAGVYQISDTEALVVSTDFFPPIVDDPLWFGRIAAANALSDIYAMGGRPLVALNILGTPGGLITPHVLGQILLGGQEKVNEAGAVIAGGHTVKDKELKYGLSVTGMVRLDQLKTNSGARPGDKIILTKPLGTGVISTAVKNGLVDRALTELVTQQMATLNRAPAEVMLKHRSSSVTDITGFGLVGHALEMAEASDVGIRIDVDAVPIIPGTIELAAQNQLTGGGKDNLNFCRDRVTYEKPLSEDMINVLHDPQTSGGLLIAVHPDDADAMMTELSSVCQHCALIGEVVEGKPGIVIKS